MSSEVEVCNNALTKLGEDLIMALTENSKAGRLCNLHYAIQRDALLRSHNWNFAVKRVALGKLASTPLYDFSAEFQLPIDFMKLIRLEENTQPFRLEGRKILASSDTLNIEYIAKITDPNQFDAMFADVLGTKIALVLAIPLSDSKPLYDAMKELLDDTLPDTRTIDGQENSPDELEADAWLNARL